MVLNWIEFFTLLVLIYFAGVRATKSADIIAEKKHLTQAFMGAIFVSMITSFPELFTGISSAAVVKSADMGIGEIIGSCIFNFTIIAAIEIFFRKSNLYSNKGVEINRQTFLPFSFSFLLMAILTLSINLNTNVTIFHVDIFSILIFGFYLFSAWILIKERKSDKEEEEKYKDKDFKKELITFIISSLVIIGVGLYLPIVGKKIAIQMGWSDAFVGVIFLSLITSFPELIVSIGAAKIGATDMILGNIAGSNMFNIAVIFFIDIFYFKGSVINDSSPKYITVGIIAMIMNFIIIFAIARKSKKRGLNLISINGLILIALYILNLIVIY